MEGWQLALLAWEGLKLLFALGGALPEAAKPMGPMTTCDHEIIREGRASCASEVTYRLLEPGEHWMVRAQP